MEPHRSPIGIAVVAEGRSVVRPEVEDGSRGGGWNRKRASWLRAALRGQEGAIPSWTAAPTIRQRWRREEEKWREESRTSARTKKAIF